LSNEEADLALVIGDEGATNGMAKDIYDKLNELLKAPVPPADLEKAQKVWKQIAFGVATGVVTHLLDNLEVSGVAVSGQANLPVANNSAAGTVTLTQTSATTGLIR
jgi:RNA-binding protein YhbY